MADKLDIRNFMTPEEYQAEVARLAVDPNANPLSGLMDPALGAQVAAMDPFQAAGQAMGVQPFVQPAAGIPEVDMSGQVAPLSPEQLTQERVAQEGLPELPIPGQTPRMIDKKIGSTSNTTTSQERSAETEAAEADMAAAGSAARASTRAAQAAADAEGAAQAELDERDQKAIATVESARAVARQNAVAAAQADLEDFNNKVAELTNTKPETFWGSKDQADKVSAALSIGLGGISQALLGNGQNVGMVLLQRRMDEFDTIQKRKYDAQLKQIDAMKTSMDMKRQLANEADKVFDAQKLAARAQIQGELARGVTLAKTAGVKAALGMKQAEFDRQIANAQMEQAAKYEAKHTQSEQMDVIKQIQQTAGLTRSGEPMNVEQARNLGFYNQMRLSLENIKDVNETDPQVKEALKQYSRDMQALTAAAALPVGGNVMSYANLKGYDTALDRLAQRNPDAYRYVQNMNGLINAKLRKESGAAISVGEYVKEYENLAVSMNDEDKGIAEKRKRRHQAAMDTYTATGL